MAVNPSLLSGLRGLHVTVISHDCHPQRVNAVPFEMARFHTEPF
jgi:hypothetical protein